MSDLQTALLEYIRVAAFGLRNTTHTGDRSIYRAHLAEAAIWLADLDAGRSPESVAEEIGSDPVRRHFFDPWLIGPEGEEAAKAFAKLLQQAMSLNASTGR